MNQVSVTLELVAPKAPEHNLRTRRKDAKVASTRASLVGGAVIKSVERADSMHTAVDKSLHTVKRNLIKHNKLMHDKSKSGSLHVVPKQVDDEVEVLAEAAGRLERPVVVVTEKNEKDSSALAITTGGRRTLELEVISRPMRRTAWTRKERSQNALQKFVRSLFASTRTSLFIVTAMTLIIVAILVL